ncbi:MAG: hypothetical protein ABJB16_05360 [Saprospiraceae bacterium]
MKTKFLYVALFGSLLSCHKDMDQITKEEIIDPPVIQVTTKLVSQTDTTFETSRYASQNFNGSTQSYSSFPYLVSPGTKIDRDFELITLTTQDARRYFQVQSLIENDVNYLHWILPPIQVFNANTSDDIHFSLSGDYILSIPKMSLLYIDGSPYSGEYHINYALLDPLTYLANAIPSFLSIDDDHQRHALQMQACLYISVTSDTGIKLQFAPAASIEVLPSLTGHHYFFNTAQSAWKTIASSESPTHLDLGSADYYAVAVEDQPVRMKGDLRINGRLTANHIIQVSYGGITRHVYSTNKGSWAIYVPIDQEITMDVPLPCGDNFSKTFVTPDKTEFELPITIIHEASLNSSFHGAIRNNKGDALNEGFISITGTSPSFLYSDQGEFNFNIPICQSNSVGIQGLDIATGQSGPVIQWQAADSVQMYSVFACNESKQEYLSLNVSGENKMYWDLKSSVNPQSRLLIEEGPTETDLDLEIAISGMTRRDYGDEELNIRFEDQRLGQHGYSLYCPTSSSGCGFSKFIITHFPEEKGQWIRGYFEGNFWIKSFYPLTAGNRPVRGEFQVYRDF